MKRFTKKQVPYKKLPYEHSFGQRQEFYKKKTTITTCNSVQKITTL